MGFIKGILKFFGSLAIFLALGLLFVSVFGSNLVDSFPDYKTDIDNEILNLVYTDLEEQTGLTREQIQRQCENDNSDFCMSFSDENLKENSPFTKLQGDLERVRYYFNAARNIGAFLLAVGLALYLLGLGVISGLKHALFSGAVASVFNYLFYKFALMGIVNSMIKDALPDGLGGILGIMKIWINSSVSETISFIMIVGVVSIASMIIFLVIKKK